MVNQRRIDDHRQLTNAKLTADWYIGSRQLLTDCQVVIVDDRSDAMDKNLDWKLLCFNIAKTTSAVFLLNSTQ